MPEKEKHCVKSQSYQDICENSLKSSDLISEQADSQVEENDNISKVTEKTKTLPNNQSRPSVVSFMGKSNQLKRPITLPKINFPTRKIKKDKKFHKNNNKENNCDIMSDNTNDTENDEIETELVLDPSESNQTNLNQQQLTSKPTKRIVKADSMKNFFVKVVNQISVSSRQKAKGVAESEERSKEWRSYFDNNSQVPGVIGIRNHGNTCFINSILQCLSFTDILAEYFVLDQYKNDLKRRRRISAFTRSNGTGRGELTEQFATLLKSLWSLQYDPEISDRFKSLVDKYGSQYKVSNDS